MALAPEYINIEDVKQWLTSKTSFGNDPNYQITDSFLEDLTGQGESIALMDISSVYEINPISTISGGDFSDLPNVSQYVLRNLFLMSAGILILNIDFGQHSWTIGEDFIIGLQKAYNTAIRRLTDKHKSGLLKAAVLPELKVNKFISLGLTAAPVSRLSKGTRVVSDNMTTAIKQVTIPAVGWYTPVKWNDYYVW